MRRRAAPAGLRPAGCRRNPFSAYPKRLAGADRGRTGAAAGHPGGPLGATRRRVARPVRGAMAQDELTGSAIPLSRLGWCHGALGAVKDARPWRAPLRGGLRPSLTAPARRDARTASDGVGRRRDEGRPDPSTRGLRPGSNKGLTGKEVAGLLASHGATPNRHGLGSRDVGGRCQLPQLFRCEPGCIRAVADLAVRHPALDPGQRVQGIPVEGGLRGRRLNGSAVDRESRRRRSRAPGSRRSGC